MPRSQERRFRLRHAIGLSAALHLLAAPLFAISGAVLFGSGTFESSVESSDSVITLERKASIRRVARRSHPATSATQRPKDEPHARPTAPGLESQRLAVARPASPARSARSTTITRLAIAARKSLAPDVTPPVIVAVDTTPAPVAIALPTMQPTAAAVVAAIPPAAAKGGFDSSVGGWGQNFERPLVADEAALNELRAKYHFSATITIRVDESGHALKVSVPDGLPSEARGEIERRLAALRYIPAECNGLRCAGSLSIVI